MSQSRAVRLDLATLSAAEREAYEALIDSKYHCCLQGKHPDNVSNVTIVAVGAVIDDKPIGIALTSVYGPLRSAHMHWLFVSEAYRHQSIASEILNAMVQELAQQLILAVTFNYPSDTPTAPFLEKLLSQQGWAPPKLFSIECTFEHGHFDPDWLQMPLQLPNGWEMFLWKNLNEQERTLLQFQKTQGVFQPAVSPFGKNEDQQEFLNSLGLRYKGEVVGWMITQRIAPDTIRYTALYIQKLHQATGLAIQLLTSSIRLHIQSGIRYGVLEVNRSQVDASWFNFIKRRLIPHAIKVTYINQTWFDLQKLIKKN